MDRYKIIKIGTLKYDRLKALSIFRKELFSYGSMMSIADAKVLFDTILNNKLEEDFDLKLQRCIDEVFEGTEYETIYEESQEGASFYYNMPNCFPDNRYKEFFEEFMNHFDENGLSAPEDIMFSRANTVLGQLKEIYRDYIIAKQKELTKE